MHPSPKAKPSRNPAKHHHHLPSLCLRKEEVEGGTPSFPNSPLQVACELQLFSKNTPFSGFPGSKMLPSAVCSVVGTELAVSEPGQRFALLSHPWW